MKLPFNLDFSERLVIKTADVPWGSDPVEGIERIPLEREHPEAGRSTSLVRYSPGSQFTAYKHELGEEIYVLDGEFCDSVSILLGLTSGIQQVQLIGLKVRLAVFFL